MSTLRERKKARTREAITAAAMRLFAQRGFAAVTIADVAAAADVGQRTVFRYFADKEELLFADDVAFRAALAAALAARPAEERPADALTAASAAVAAALADRRDELARRQAVIRTSPALQARERAKHAGFETVIAEALERRGVATQAARLLARVGVACYDEAIDRWLTDVHPHRPGIASRIRESFAELQRLLAPGAAGEP